MRRCAAHRARWGLAMVKSNYIADFAADFRGLPGSPRTAGDLRLRNAPDRYIGRAGRHAVGHRRTVSSRALALARALEDEPGADQEPAPDLSRRRDRARPRGARSAVAPAQLETVRRSARACASSRSSARRFPPFRTVRHRAVPFASRCVVAANELDSAPRIIGDPGEPRRARRAARRPTREACIQGRGYAVAGFPARRSAGRSRDQGDSGLCGDLSRRSAGRESARSARSRSSSRRRRSTGRPAAAAARRIAGLRLRAPCAAESHSRPHHFHLRRLWRNRAAVDRRALQGHQDGLEVGHVLALYRRPAQRALRPAHRTALGPRTGSTGNDRPAVLRRRAHAGRDSAALSTAAAPLRDEQTSRSCPASATAWSWCSARSSARRSLWSCRRSRQVSVADIVCESLRRGDARGAPGPQPRSPQRVSLSQVLAARCLFTPIWKPGSP